MKWPFNFVLNVSLQGPTCFKTDISKRTHTQQGNEVSTFMYYNTRYTCPSLRQSWSLRDYEKQLW